MNLRVKLNIADEVAIHIDNPEILSIKTAPRSHLHSPSPWWSHIYNAKQLLTNASARVSLQLETGESYRYWYRLTVANTNAPLSEISLAYYGIELYIETIEDADWLVIECFDPIQKFLKV